MKWTKKLLPIGILAFGLMSWWLEDKVSFFNPTITNISLGLVFGILLLYAILLIIELLINFGIKMIGKFKKGEH